MLNRTVRSSLAVLLLAAAALAADPPADLVARALDAYAKKQFAESADLFAQAIAAGADDASTLYNAACASALAGRTDAALDLLDRAVAAGFTNADHMKRDTDFASISGSARFQQIIAKAATIAARHERFWKSPAIATPYAETLSLDERIAGLSRVWSEAKFNFAYFDLVPDLDWDALYVSYLPRVRETESTAEYYKLLMSFIAHLRDGHTGINPPAEILARIWSEPPARVTQLEGRMIITEVLDPALRDLAGAEITAIDGVPVADYARERVSPYLPASTPQDLASRTARQLLYGAAGTPLELTLVDANGRTSRRSLRRFTEEEAKAIWKPETAFAFRMLPGGVAYVALNHFGDTKAADGFLEHFGEIAAAKGLIIDVRRNGGGNSGEGYRVLGALTDKPFQTSRWATRLYKPTYRAWGRAEETFEEGAGEGRPNGDLLFTGPVVVLTSAATYSAAEDFVVAFDAMKRGTIIGEPTGGSTGQPLLFRLPGGGSARVCTKRDSYPDGKAFVGVGVQPQLVVHPTVKDARAGADTVLAAALEFLRSN